MSAVDVERDERTVAIENAGYRWSFLVMSFGLLLAVAYRSFARGEASWDLLALVVVPGVMNAGYQWSHRVLQRRWLVVTAVTLVLAGILGAVFAFVLRAS